MLSERHRRAMLAAGFAVLVTAGSMAAPDDEPPFPAEYRTWAHVKSVLVRSDHPAYATEGGIHHIYANPAAVTGYRTGTFPDGSVIVYDLLETTEKAGLILEGKNRRIDVMMKDSARFASSHGWGFARFTDGPRTSGALSKERQAQCLECHAKRKDHDYVQGDWRP
jgi:cytochrome P460